MTYASNHEILIPPLLYSLSEDITKVVFHSDNIHDKHPNILTVLYISHKLPDMLRKTEALTYIWRIFSSLVG